MEEKQRVEANRADILVTVAGASLFSGAVALQKAREVAELVTLLQTVEVEATQIKVEDIRAQTQSGTFSKNSSVSYDLRIENVPLEHIANAIGILTSAKNATITDLEWGFPDEIPLRDALRAKCLDNALRRAKIIAQTLGIRLIGIYDLGERWEGVRYSSDSRGVRSHDMVMMRSRVSELELGLSISHSEEVELKITIQFRVSEFGN